MMWLALPPVNAWPLAWIAPVCWLVLVRRKTLDGRRPYLKIYLAGLAFWLTTLYWLTLPHWSTSFAWLGLSWYLAFYVPLFVALCRVAVHRLRVPMIFAAPVIWTALEVVRGHFGGGFLMAALGHTQYQWIGLIQLSDLVGAYGVSFIVMLVAACLTQMLPVSGSRRAIWPLAPLALAMAAALGYGHFRMAAPLADSGAVKGGAVQAETGKKIPTIAIIQGSVDTEFGGTKEEQSRRLSRMFNQYLDLTVEALRKAQREGTKIDLVVWPESMYPYHVTLYDRSRIEEPSLSRETANGQAVESRSFVRRVVTHIRHLTRVPGQPTRQLGPAMLLGADTAHFETEDSHPTRHSTSLFVDGSGEIVDHYHKMHPVMFGEYVPLGHVFPAVYKLTPLQGGLSAGEAPVSFKVASVNVAPNICYETVIPHLIRRQVAELIERGEEPDVLITQTNDGWFWGSAALDMHLVCGVFRAVECRKPLLIAANTGISAWVDADGRLVKQCERRKQQVIIARPRSDDRESLYVRGGDWFGWSCVVLTGLIAPLGWRRRRRQNVKGTRI